MALKMQVPLSAPATVKRWIERLMGFEHGISEMNELTHAAPLRQADGG
jgi:hypothetical protein